PTHRRTILGGELGVVPDRLGGSMAPVDAARSSPSDPDLGGLLGHQRGQAYARNGRQDSQQRVTTPGRPTVSLGKAGGWNEGCVSVVGDDGQQLPDCNRTLRVSEDSAGVKNDSDAHAASPRLASLRLPAS